MSVSSNNRADCNMVVHLLYDYLRERGLPPGVVAYVGEWFGMAGYEKVNISNSNLAVHLYVFPKEYPQYQGPFVEAVFWGSRSLAPRRFNLCDPGVFDQVYDFIVSFLVKDKCEG